MSRAYGWRASCPAGGVTAVGVGSGAWFASVVWAAWIIWDWGFDFLGSEILDSGLLRCLEIHSSESFAPSRTGIGYWRHFLSGFWASALS
jgi:hypothetical protein